MWDQVYTPVAGSLGASALVAALPIAVMLVSLGVFRLAAWKSGLLGLATVIVVSGTVYGMPLPLLASATLYGAAFGLFPVLLPAVGSQGGDSALGVVWCLRNVN